MKCLLAVLLFSPAAVAGVLVGNDGGDSIFCEASGAKFPESGMYVLDYAVSFPEPSQIKVEESLTAGLDRIERLLSEKAPQALPSFRSFRPTLDPAPFVETEERFWWAAERPLNNIRDEYVKVLPPNCRFKGSNSKDFGIFQQTVVRSRFKNRRLKYEYDRDFVEDYLRRQDHTQALILFVHEWLWDFYENDRNGAPKIRAANAFLLSSGAENAPGPLFRDRLFRAKAGE